MPPPVPPDVINSPEGQKAAEGLVALVIAIFSAAGGFLVKKRPPAPAGFEELSAQVRDIHAALLTVDPDLQMSPLEQLRMVTRYVSVPDDDGNRVSLLRQVLKSLVDSMNTQTRILERLEKRLSEMEERHRRKEGV